MKSILLIAALFFLAPALASAQDGTVQDSLMKKPIILWGDLAPGRHPAEDVRKQVQIKLPAGYKLKAATVYFTGANFTTVEKFSIASEDLSGLREAISRCVPGSVVILEKILVTYNNGSQQMFLRNSPFVCY